MSTGQKILKALYVGAMAGLAFFIIAILVIALITPFVNYIGGENVKVMYSWYSPNTVKIKPVLGSAVPFDYTLYIYSVNPERDEESNNTYRIPLEDEWKYIGYTKGPGYIDAFGHTELFKAVCLKTGTNPETVLVEHNGSFDTSLTDNLIVEIECH